MMVGMLKKRKKSSNVSFAYVDKVMNGLARSIKESSKELKTSMEESNEAFRKRMEKSNEEFKKRTEESNEAFRIRTEEANEAFRKRMEKSNEESRKRTEETDEAFRRRTEEANETFRKEIRESLDESDKRFNERMLKSEKEWNKKMGEIYNRLGDIAEYTFVPEAILEKFQDLNYEFDNYCRRERVIGKDGCARAEYDVVLRNGDTVALIEIKSTFKYEYIDRFIQQISVATNEKYKGKKIIGAIAALELPKEVKNYALSKGLYVIEQAGRDIKIDTLDGKFRPKIW
jgi:hypothetical protein